MQIFFVHQNFPGQFGSLALACVGRGDEVRALRAKSSHGAPIIQGVKTHQYDWSPPDSARFHRQLIELETKFHRGETVRRVAIQLRAQGFSPTVIVAHPGWGEALFLKSVWPRAKLLLYGEFFYHPRGHDVGFDPEISPGSDQDIPRIHLKNAANLAQFPQSDAILSPTRWQASTFPKNWRRHIHVIHDGVDAHRLDPSSAEIQSLKIELPIPAEAPVVTFVSRDLEPYRGYHIMMRALPEIFKRLPDAHIIVIGGDSVNYGPRAPEGTTWKERFWQEVKGKVNQEQVHFLGKVPYKDYLACLQRAQAHVYLTYPFVLSWSLLEAMSLGKAIVASDTPPVREVIRNRENGMLFPFFEPEKLAHTLCDVLTDAAFARKLGSEARKEVLNRFDLQTICLPRRLQLIDRLANMTTHV